MTWQQFFRDLTIVIAVEIKRLTRSGRGCKVQHVEPVGTGFEHSLRLRATSQLQHANTPGYKVPLRISGTLDALFGAKDKNSVGTTHLETLLKRL